MKTFLKTAFAMFAMLMISAPALAQHDGNGGEPSERKFRHVTTNIRQWIEAGNAQALNFRPGTDYVRYKTEMLKVLKNFHVSIKPIDLTIEGDDKTCINRVSKKTHVRRIVCDSRRFEPMYRSDINETYRIIHHEIAGLAGLEVNEGKGSDYFFSDQVSAKLESVTTQMLPIEPRVPGQSVTMDAPVLPVRSFLRDSMSDVRPKSVPGTCRAANREQILTETYGSLVASIVAMLKDGSGYPVKSVAAAINEVTSIDVSFKSGSRGSWIEERASVSMSITLNSGAILDVAFQTGRSDSSVAVEGFNLGFSEEYFMTYNTDRTLNSKTTNCQISPRLVNVKIVNRATGELISEIKGQN